MVHEMNYPCPKCNEHLPRQSTIDFDGEILSVFQCNTCVAYWRVAGRKFETSLTFAVTPKGSMVDPDAPYRMMMFE